MLTEQYLFGIIRYPYGDEMYVAEYAIWAIAVSLIFWSFYVLDVLAQVVTRTVKRTPCKICRECLRIPVLQI